MSETFDAAARPDLAYIAKLRANPDLWDRENSRWRPNLYPENFSMIAEDNTKIRSRSVPLRDVRVETLWSERLINASPLIAYNAHFNGPKLTTALTKRGIMSAISKHVPLDKQIKVLTQAEGHLVWKVLGIADHQKEMDTLKTVFEKVAKNQAAPHLNVMIDASNGHMEQMPALVEDVRKTYGKMVTIVAGNVVTASMTRILVQAGADGIKGNHGPAEICDTHAVAGEHSATLTTTLRCAEAAHELGAFYICDGGGLSTSGNAVMQLVAGADFLMTGGLFAGVRECDEDFIKMVDANGNTYEAMAYSGGASKATLDRNYNGVAEHRPIEGRTRFVRLKTIGLEGVVRQWHNGIASACSFAGVYDPHDLRGKIIEPTRPRRDYVYE